MNKTLHINLGGRPFIIDEDAYRRLESYLASVHRHFRHSAGYAEITDDIEARLAELFTEWLAGAPIVHLAAVEAVITTMGTPESFGTEAESSAGPTSAGAGSYHPGKRLYRNPDGKIIAGVCTGLAAYVGLEDAVWVRVLFAILLLTTGIGVIAYLVLWAVLPEAKTAADRLAMKGDPINVTTIGRQIEEELENVKQMAVELGEELQTAFGGKRR